MALTVPVEEISASARQADPMRVVLTLLALIPFIAGWVAGKVWLALAWTYAAVVAGWRQARGTTPDKGEGG